MLDILEIMKRIPHRYPFLLVDRILEMDKEAQTIKGKKNVTMNEEFFNGHFPGHPVMPGVLVIEGMAQCLGVLVMESALGKVPYFAAIENTKFRNPVRPGDTLIYDVKVDKVKRNFVKASGKTYVDDTVVAEASFTFVIADA
ncbi:3-hydroxyacyl-ACP dehydratase FabZ [Fusobacterium sp. oral taxon C10]